MKKLILAVLVVIPVAALGYWATACPCGQTPGLYVRGALADEKVTNWSFANQVPLCQVEVDTGLLPHALNLNCWADSGGDLYLSCGSCDGKRWSTAAVARNEARVRVAQTVYPVTLTRVMDDRQLDRAWASRAVKLAGASEPRPRGWGTFRVASR
ncbi:MAG TPA: hypothetical protein VM032_02175 [Vicinamibacterales bacterium]|nr:hypothetical protein [Vicinamibacterales bacterium]